MFQRPYRRLLMAAQRAGLSVGIAVLLAATNFAPPPAFALGEPGLAALAAQQARAAREADIAALSGKLESIAAELRRVRPKGSDAPVANLDAASGEAAPLKIGQRILQTIDELGDFETRIDAQWREEAEEMTALGIPAEVVARHVELLAEVRTNAARFRELVASLRSAQSRSSTNAAATALVDLSGWFAGLASAKGYKAIEKAQLPLQFARADAAPQPATAMAESVVAPNAITDPPGPGEIAPTLEIEFTPEIRALAQSLGGQPVAIRNWVYDNIEFMPTFGSIQGAGLTLLNRRGNAFDIASLTLALMRVSGVPARYAHGVVEVPIDKAQNWLGNLATPQMAVELMQKGGIPAASVIAGGRIVAVRFEHVWIEAWVDFIPSRGAINRVPDQWVPLDVAYKEFTYEDALPWRSQTLQARQDAVRDFAQRVSVDANGGIKGFDFDRLNAALQTVATNYAATTVGGAPDTTPQKLYDQRTITPIDSLVLHGTLPFPLKSTTVSRYLDLPASLRHTTRIAFFTDETSVRYDSPSNEIVLPLARIGTRRLTMEYVPATPADAQTIATYAESNAASLPLAQINVIPKLMLGDEVLFQSGATRMGTQHFWKVDVRDTHGNESVTEAYKFAAGSQILFGSDLAGTTAERVERESAQWPDVAYQPTKEALYQGGLLYWLLTDHMDDQAARSVGGRALRLPSIGAFAQPMEVRYFFGVPRTGFVAGQVTDLKSVRIGTSVPRAADAIQLSIHLGSAGSMAEGATWNLLGGTGRASIGLSAATLLKTAIDQGQRLFQIDRTNVTAALAQLQLSVDAEDEIRQAAASGLTIVAPEREIQYRGWSGAGYVIIDLSTGSSLQRVEGGLAGGINIGCIVKAVSLKALCNSKIFKIASRYLLGILARIGARAIAMAGLTAMFAAVAPVVGVVLPILAAVGTAIAIAMAVYEVAQWVRGIMDGWETLTPDELAELGIKAINDIACSYAPPCFGGMGFGGGGDGGGAGGPLLGNPVAVGSGAKWQTEEDFTASGTFPLYFSRTYVSSVPRAESWIGSKWVATYFQSLRLPPAIDGDTFPVSERPDSVMLNRPEGGWFQFDWRGTGYFAESNVPGRLERVVAGSNTSGWRYTTTDDETELYDAQGRLLSITHHAGIAHTLTYDALMRPIRVTDSFNRTIEFAYDPDTGYLATVTDPMRRVTKYSHDDDGNLTNVEYADGRSRTYHYDDVANRYGLTGITDERGIRVSSWTYDHLGRVATFERSGGVDRHAFRYEKDTTVVVDPRGTQRTYDFARIYDRPYLKKVTEPCAACGSGVAAESTYDARGLVASTRDFENNLTTYGRSDPRGLITSTTQASGTSLARTFTTTWEPNWYQPTKTSEPIENGTRETTYRYDPEGNLLSRTVAAGGQSRVWTYTYNANGQVLTEDGPRTDVSDTIVYTYDVAGNLESETDEAGNRIRYTSYFDNGLLSESIDENGLITQLRYDLRDRLTQSIEKTSAADPGETTTFEYDAAGNLRKVIAPDGSFVSYSYDPAGRTDGMADSAGNATHYTLDEQGRRTLEETTDPDGTLAQRTGRVIDALGRLEKLQGAMPGETTQYAYDGDGNLESVTDPLSHKTTHTYDALRRLVRSELLDAADPDRAVAKYDYDRADNPTLVVDARNLETRLAYTGFDEAATTTSPDAGVTRRTYDAAGNEATRTDARGQRMVARYDAANRMTDARFGAADPALPNDSAALASVEEAISFHYDQTHGGDGAKNRLTEMRDGAASTRYTYDRHGRVVGQAQALGNGSGGLERTIAHRYDAGARLERTTLPSGAIVDYGYGADGRVAHVSVNDVAVASDIRYFPFGEPKAWSQGAGGSAFRYQRRFDLDGRIESHSLGDTQRELDFDVAGRITALAENLGAAAQWTFTHDGQDRLKTAVNAVGAGPTGNQSLEWRYDANGNRMAQIRTSPAPAATDVYAIAATSNRIESLNGVARTYDLAGNLASDGRYRYNSNARNRVSIARLQGNGAVQARYAYNARGQRVCKATGDSHCPQGPGASIADGGSGTFTQYVYDDHDRLLGEYAPDGALIAEHLWVGSVPVAVVKPAAFAASHGGLAAGAVAVFFVEPDHLNSPRLIVNSAHQPVWRWDSTPFGDVVPNQNPGGRGDFVYVPRFPGQQYDPETQTNYNQFRDYDAAIGRYLQSDPIGIDGGLNTYAYVGAQPLSYSDALGLKYLTPPGKFPGGGGFPGKSGKSAGAAGAMPCSPCNKDKRSRDYKGPTQVYWIVDRSNNTIYKVGKSSQKSGAGSNRCERQASKLNAGLNWKRYRCYVRRQFCGTSDALDFERYTRDWLRANGNPLPGNMEGY